VLETTKRSEKGCFKKKKFILERAVRPKTALPTVFIPATDTRTKNLIDQRIKI